MFECESCLSVQHNYNYSSSTRASFMKKLCAIRVVFVKR